MKKTPIILASVAMTLLALSAQPVNAGGKSFAKIVPALDGAPPEGFTIGKGTTAYNASIDGSIYKVNLRNGKGEIFVEAEPDFDLDTDCNKLGMRVDRRSNYLFVAGCDNGDAYVFDADSGEEIMKYQLDDSDHTTINDIAITQDAVYFTDFRQPFIYRLPLSKNGRIPGNEDAATAIPLSGDFDVPEDNLIDRFANGIVATPDGKTLIVGHSGSSKIFRVDPTTGHADEIIVDPPLIGLLEGGFQDALVLHDGVLFILTPDASDTYPPVDRVQVVTLSEDMLTGTLVGSIIDPDMDGVASGAFHGDSLYVNNARYSDYPEPTLEYWVTKLNIYDLQ
jgi:sugar lactone lactonase YvrE